MSGWELVVGFNFITAAAYVGIAWFIVRGLVRTGQLLRNYLAVATAAIFITCSAHHVLHALDLVGGGDAMRTSMMREMMGQSIDVIVTFSTAVTGVLYLGLRRSYGMLLRSSPSMFDHAAETRYRQLAANLPHTAITVFNRDLRYVLVGGAGLGAVGYTRADMEGRLIADVVPPQVFARLQGHYLAALNGQTSEFDHTSTVTGAVFHNRMSPLRDEGGRVIGGLAISEDVTTARRLATQLHDAQAFNTAVLAASPDITAITSMATGEMTWASRSVLELLGWPAEQLLADEGPRLLDLVLEEDKAALVKVRATVGQLADGDSCTFRFRIRSPEGYRWLARQSTPFRRDQHGAVVSYLSVVRDVTDIVEVERRMEHAALHDPLTGLPNRALLLDRMGTALARADRLGAEVAVLFCDLDGFKKVNDTYGHAAGDAVLVQVTERLKDLIRKSDTVARVGGDEFVVILDPAPVKLTATPQPTSNSSSEAPNMFLRQVASTVADRIRTELSRPLIVDGRRHNVSVSVGMTYAQRGSTALNVLRDADIALYRAKQRGKNRIEVFDESFGADVAQRNRVETELRLALDPDRAGPPALTVAYQPVYDLADNSLVGFEALARLTDTTGIPIPPDAFIPIAEETGLINALGEQILDQALACLATWHAAHPHDRPATMAVNLSARQAQHADMPRVVQAALTRHHLQPSDLILELTESVLLESGTSTLRQFTELRRDGVGIAIDDFGTGYASLRYLATLPVSSVKVDRTFTATITTDHTSATIVNAILTLARDLNLDCVVEGLETHEQIAALPTQVQGQGYLLGRPTATPQSTWLAAAAH